jgi:hypothetical protein
MDDFGAHALQDAAHDVDGGIVPIKQTGGGDKTDFVGRAVLGQSFEFSGQIGHGCLLVRVFDVDVNVNQETHLNRYRLSCH